MDASSGRMDITITFYHLLTTIDGLFRAVISIDIFFFKKFIVVIEYKNSLTDKYTSKSSAVEYRIRCSVLGAIYYWSVLEVNNQRATHTIG